MKSCRYILFDLDGTLTDPGLGIMNSIRFTFDQLGLPPRSEETLRRFIGPPLHDGFRKYGGLDDELTRRAVDYYHLYFGEKGIYENYLYPGIKKLLGDLRGDGRILALATSKPAFFAGRVVEHFGLGEYFAVVAGGELDGRGAAKGEVIRKALRELGLEAGERAVMIGDRKYDILGAKENGLASIGETYGYGSREELETAGASRIADSVEELGRILLERAS